MLKNIICLSLSLFISFSTCLAQKSKYAKVHTEEINLESFDALDLEGVFNVYLQKSNEESILIETNKDYHDLISVDVRGGTLEIYMKNNKNLNLKKFNLYINYKNLNSIDVDIVGNLVAEDEIDGDKIELIIDGVGNSSFNFNCKTLDAEFKRIGNIEISGKVENVMINSKCTGNLRCRDLIAQNLKLSSNQIGNIDVHAEDTLDIEASGVGNVTYSGNAKIVNLDSSGVGKVRKL